MSKTTFTRLRRELPRDTVYEGASGYTQAVSNVWKLIDAMHAMQDDRKERLFSMLWALIIVDSDNKFVYELAMELL